MLRHALKLCGVVVVTWAFATDTGWVSRRNPQQIVQPQRATDLESNLDLCSTPAFKFLVIASLKRSASTSLLYEYFGRKYSYYECSDTTEFPIKKTIHVIPVNEVFNNFEQVQSGDHWKVDAWDMPGLSRPKDAKQWQLKMFLQRVHKRRCKDTNMQNMCVIALKLFSDHLKLEQHYAILSLQDVRVIVLERDFASRLTSLMYALQSGDWDTKGRADHKAALLQAQITVPNATDCEANDNETMANNNETMAIACKFYRRHVQWYEFLRKTVDVYAELTYDDVLKLVEGAKGENRLN